MPKAGYRSITLSEMEYAFISEIAKKENRSIRKSIISRYGI